MDASSESTSRRLGEIDTGKAVQRPSLVPSPEPSTGYSRKFIARFIRLFGWLLRLWFRPRVEGWENIPSGPCLFVGNHSGYGVMEVLVLVNEWYRRFGFRRPVAGLCHDIGFWPLFRWVVVPIGGIRASIDDARRAMQAGTDVLVFPGGDLDALRPFRLRYSIRWGNRRGFLDLAMEQRVPVVPIVNCGSHAQYTVLPGGRFIGRLLCLRKLRLEEWGIPVGACVLLGASAAWIMGVLAGAWVWVAFLLAMCPNPTRMRIKFLPLVSAEALINAHGGPNAAKEALRQNMERELRSLAEGRLTPWF